MGEPGEEGAGREGVRERESELAAQSKRTQRFKPPCGELAPPPPRPLVSSSPPPLHEDDAASPRVPRDRKWRHL